MSLVFRIEFQPPTPETSMSSHHSSCRTVRPKEGSGFLSGGRPALSGRHGVGSSDAADRAGRLRAREGAARPKG